MHSRLDILAQVASDILSRTEEPVESDILNSAHWKDSPIVNTPTITQEELYRRQGADDYVLKEVRRNSKGFGTVSEKIVINILGLGPRTSSQNDATWNGWKIEIKCARIWVAKSKNNDCVWQHIEENHDFDYIIFAFLDLHGWKVWGMLKKDLFSETLLNKKVIVRQGNQGWWACKSALLPYMTPIKTAADLPLIGPL